MQLIANGYVKTIPKIVHPPCHIQGEEQDCRACPQTRRQSCQAPTKWCTAPYPDHRKGCPNYGMKDNCPPGMPVFDQLFDCTENVYLIFSQFDLEEHVKRMQERHPHWTLRQCRCCLYWQHSARKQHREHVTSVIRQLRSPSLYSTDVPEAMAVDVSATAAAHGLHLQWPPLTHTFRISLAGFVRQSRLQHPKAKGRTICLDGGRVSVRRTP